MRAVSVSANGKDTLALKSDGTVWAWGGNGSGQLGDGSTTSRTAPVQVAGLSGVTAIAAGVSHSLAVKSDGTVWAWGDNTYGQLGQPSTLTGSTTPVQVPGLAAAGPVAAGTGHSVVGLADGSLRAFGLGTQGQLGNGASLSSASPVTVTGVTLPPASTSASYGYDGDGLRASRTVGATTQHFGWDLSGLPLLLTDGASSYLYDDAGLPVEQVDTAGTVLYYQHDQLGSTRLLTDSSGAVAATYTFDAHGATTSHTGAADTPLRFAGQYRDAESGLYYLRARYYDPSTAQFLTRDPLAALTGAAYGYAYGDPLNVGDPSGLCPTCDDLAEQMNSWADYIKAKAAAIASNPRALPLTGRNKSYKSHLEPFLGYQKHLRGLMEQWLDLGCGSLDDLPDNVLDQATRPVPPPTPSHRAASNQHSFWDAVGAGVLATLLVAGKAVAAGVCGGAAVETGPGAVAAGAACAAAAP